MHVYICLESSICRYTPFERPLIVLPIACSTTTANVNKSTPGVI